MNTKLNAPARVGSTSSAAASIDRSGWLASNSVTRSVSLLAGLLIDGAAGAALRRPATAAASSPALTRFPLCASAIEPVEVDVKVGCAFSHTDDPLVE
jgi:hypothetical protein